MFNPLSMIFYALIIPFVLANFNVGANLNDDADVVIPSVFEEIAANDSSDIEKESSAQNPYAQLGQGTDVSASSGSGATENLKILDSGYLVKGNTVFYALEIQNPNPSKIAKRATIDVTIKDANGTKVKADTLVANYIFADSSITIGAGVYVDNEASTVEFSIRNTADIWIDGTMTEAEFSKYLSIDDVSVTPSEREGFTVFGDMVNATSSKITARISYVFYDDAGSILWGDSYYETAEPDATTPFSMEYVTEFPDFANVKVFANPTDL